MIKNDNKLNEKKVLIENIIIRNIEKKDIEAAVDIQIAGWKTAYRGIVDNNYLDSLEKKDKIKKMKEIYKRNGFIVAEKGGRIVGLCKYIDNNSYSPEIQKADCGATIKVA